MSKVDLYTDTNPDALKQFEDNSIDAIVTDGPYGLKFMGKHWDHGVPSKEIMMECLRVLKPGGYMLSFSGTRTYHRMAVNVEDAGFEIRDMIAWVYGSGFPKSLDVSKAIDNAQGVKREVIKKVDSRSKYDKSNRVPQDRSDEGGFLDTVSTLKNITSPATEEAKQWDGWGTALKPSFEPIVLARKPLIGTVAENVLKHGTGGINIDASRIEFETDKDKKSAVWGRGTDIMGGNYVGATHTSGKENIEPNQKGRFPANLIHDGSEEVLEIFPYTKSGSLKPHHVLNASKTKNIFNELKKLPETTLESEGSAARFFYCAKPSVEERDAGLWEFESKAGGG